MSRCFPFPPPGYERKNEQEGIVLLKEADRKEKKHKKEKKDKEKKKNKERNEKDGTDEKHRHKKHRKEKHKDKKEKHKDRKDKEDRSKDKEKSSIPKESTDAAKIEEEGGEKHNSRVQNHDRSTLAEERSSNLFKGQNGVEPFQDNLLSREIKDSKSVYELDRRFRAETSGGSQLPVDKVTCLDTKGRETDARAAIRNSSGVSAPESEYNKDKIFDYRKIDVRDCRNGVGGTPVEKHKERGWEGGERYSETGDVNQEDKHKDRGRKIHGKGKDKEKKREKSIVKTEKERSDQDRIKKTGNSYNVSISSNANPDLLKEPNNSSRNDGNINKRKDVVSNGFLLDSDVRHAKIQRQAPYQALENGRKVEGCHTPGLPTPYRHVGTNNIQLVKKESLNNGVIEGHKPSPSKPSLPSTAFSSDKKSGFSKLDPNLNNKSAVPMLDDLIKQALRRSPHPDSKFLSKVLTVPKLEELSDTDDQEWLFSKKEPSNELKSTSIFTEDEICVWSEAIQIDSADICALPYVIPL